MGWKEILKHEGLVVTDKKTNSNCYPQNTYNPQNREKAAMENKPGYFIICPYKGQPREIYPAVCEWHLEENDPACWDCKNRILH